jgi:hypothetical protein
LVTVTRIGPRSRLKATVTGPIFVITTSSGCAIVPLLLGELTLLLLAELALLLDVLRLVLLLAELGVL